MGDLIRFDMGRCDYSATLDVQGHLVARVQASGGDRAYLILVEHDPPVITLGRRARREHVLATSRSLAAEGIELIESRRGGDVTYHGPGQVVAYPIVRLPTRHAAVRGYVRNLEEAVIRVLGRFGVTGERRAGHVGVWVGGAKIAAIGVAVSRRVAHHGLALNVGRDLRGFDTIVPCGIRGASVTSLSQQLGRDVPMAQVKDALAASLCGVLGFNGCRRASLGAMGLAPSAAGDPLSGDGPSSQPQADLSRPRPRLPRWLRRQIPTGRGVAEVRGVIEQLGLSTVCQSAKCPNQAECFARRTATFMILGDRCTRACRFCAVEKGPPRPVDDAEPHAVAEACCRLGLRHVVVTSVTRDDLPDGGAGHFARVVWAVRMRLPHAVIEILTPDFQGSRAAIDAALEAGCDVFNHNVETAARLYPAVRPQADYWRSLSVLEHARRHASGVHIKSGMMVGLGETRREIRHIMRDLRDVGCEILTIGQYLAPSPDHHPVARFVTPGEFLEMELEAKDLGFSAVASGALVRSSYRAEDLFRHGGCPSRKLRPS